MHVNKSLIILADVSVVLLLGGCTPGEGPAAGSTSPSAGTSAAAVPPKYLRVSDFQGCLETVQVGSHEQWCMPSEKPANCPAESWEQLGALEGDDALPSCR
ncbi:MAG: hypothetical protein H3C57_01780 [Gammaproteobacteria bacterium]|nr:hypothetical protein [Gammaproteobacteria bacterium]